MNIRLRTVMAALIVLGSALVLFGFYLVQHGFSASEKPSWFEEFLARHARRIATPASAKRLKNPESLTPEIFEEASSHWMEHCAGCHAPDGGGDALVGKNLYPQAADMKSPTVQGLTDGELFYIISNGIRFTGMPAWGGEDSPEDIWKLVLFIRHLPQLTPQELDAMKRGAEHEHEHETAQPGAPGGHEHGETTPHQHEHTH